MKQVSKFYLASFLKNQTYFVPILVIFFQDLGLSFTEIFWILTGGAIFSFLIEIPTGIIADLYGKRKSILLSKAVITLAFIGFGCSTGFLSLLFANLLYELGKSFRSGTETAYTYDYLESDSSSPGYTRVKAGQKFYARLSESIAAAIGGFLAVHLGFNAVFYLAAIPAGINFLQTLTWAHIKESDSARNVKASITFTKDAFKTVWKTQGLLTIIFNVLIFSSVFVVLGTFVQPYMTEAGLSLEYFGLVYSGFLIIMAFLTRFASNLEERFGGVRVLNVLTLLAILPLIIIGSGYTSIIGISLFFVVLMIQNIRSPIENTVFHDRVQSKQRATMGSILSLGKTAGQIAILPLMGYAADAYSMHTAILILAGLVLIAATLLRISQKYDKDKSYLSLQE